MNTNKKEPCKDKQVTRREIYNALMLAMAFWLAYMQGSKWGMAFAGIGLLLGTVNANLVGKPITTPIRTILELINKRGK